VILLPLLSIFTEGEPKVPCLSNLKQSMIAQVMYGVDHDDRLSPATRWMDACLPYAKHDDLFACPYARRADPRAYGHAMNFALSAASQEDEPDPIDTIVLFDSVLLARNACSGFYGLPDPPRHKLNPVAFLDTHVRALSSAQIATYGPDGRKRRSRVGSKE
jgi:hypothetical protein